MLYTLNVILLNVFYIGNLNKIKNLIIILELKLSFKETCE